MVSTMKNYALIENGSVVNVTVWDGNTETWAPPAGMTAVLVPPGVPVSIGYAYDGSNFAAPAEPAPPAPSAEQVAASYETALQSALDTGAQAWGYDNIVSAASYAASTVAQFKAEAAALIGWRDASWIYAKSVTLSAPPASVAVFLAAAPAAPTRPKAPQA